MQYWSALMILTLIGNIYKGENAKMKQIGNLAVVCALRCDVLLQIQGNQISLYVGSGSQREYISANWDDDEKICNLVHELNFGKYAGGHND